VNRPYRRAYDHRLRDLVCEERNPALLAQLAIPRSTAASWIRRGSRSIVTSELFAQDEQALRARVLKLERRVQLLLGIMRLLFAVVRLFDFRLDSQRVPSGEAKSTILGAIDRAKKRIPVTVALRVLGLSASRYHAWLRLDHSCSLDDRRSCPRTVPSQLTHQEIATVRDLATAMEFRHMPIRVLALYAQRIGRVFAAPATWGRLIRERGRRRPRQRVYPARPKEGIRSTERTGGVGVGDSSSAPRCMSSRTSRRGSRRSAGRGRVGGARSRSHGAAERPSAVRRGLAP
jgi:hypothetical protein